mgnify:CR=1 FL=1
MYREERVRTALAGKEVDRVPVMHLSAFDQDPISLAEAEVDLEVDLTEKYDFDYIKMMTKLYIKIHMKSDSAIESEFP